MTTQPPSLLSVLHALAAEAGAVVEFEARAQDLLAERLGADLAREVVGGHVPPPRDDERRECAEMEDLVATGCMDGAEWRQLVETMPQIVWITRPDGWHTHFNRRWMEFTGLTLEQSLGFGWNPPCHPSDRERAARRWEEATSSGEPYEIEYRLRSADGTYRWMLGRAMPLRDETGRIVRWFGTCTDIDELKVAQAQLAAQAQLLDLTPDAIVVHDLQHRILHWNQGATRIHGWSADEAIGRRLGELVGTDTAQIEAAMESLLRDGEWHGEMPGADRSGEPRILECRWSLLHDDDGEPHAVLAVNTDLTDRRRTEAELEQSRSLQRMAGDIAQLGGWSIDVARQEVAWSDELHDILDYPRQSPPQLREAISRYSSPDDGRVEQALDQCAATGVPFDLEAQIETYDARQIWVRVIGGPRYGPRGTITHIDGAFQDIDQLKASTQRAEKLGERFTRTLESITDALWTVDGDWRITYINRRGEALLQRSRDELLGADLWAAFPEAVGGVLDEVYHRVMRTGVSEVLEEFHWHPVDAWLDVHVFAADEGLAVYFRDVGDQRATRLELREWEARVAEQAALLDKARDAIVVRDLDHRVTYWNLSAERRYGYGAEEALGHSVQELIGHDDGAFGQASAELLEHGEWVGELRHPGRDGSEVITEAHWTLVRDDDGQPTSVLSIESDVTERRRLERQLLRTQRLESLGTLAGGIAHDLNNMLSPILLAAQTLQVAQPDPHVADMLSIIEQSAHRGADMVRRVLTFARGHDGVQDDVDLEEVVNQTTAIVRETFPPNIELHREGPSVVPSVTGDFTQLHQVLMNLCINARDAMPDGGHLRIALEVATVTDDAIAHDCPPGPYLTVRVQDTGTGMDAPTLERVFEPFYTTKPEGQGTGLGLSTSHGIVRSHGGFIQLSSQPGAGTTFVVHLPVASDTTTRPVALTTDELSDGAGQLLLLIDDEANVRAVTRAILEAHGYRVIEAANGREALPLFDDHKEEIAGVITDMSMPHMDGPTTIDHLLARSPTTPILAVSGLTARPEIPRSAWFGTTRILGKPYSRDDLLTAVGQLVAAGAPGAAPHRPSRGAPRTVTERSPDPHDALPA